MNQHINELAMQRVREKLAKSQHIRVDSVPDNEDMEIARMYKAYPYIHAAMTHESDSLFPDLTRCEYDEKAINSIVTAARDDPIAWSACTWLATEFLDKGLAPPAPVASWASFVVRGWLKRPPERGRSKHKQFFRDLDIARAVDEALQTPDVSAFRNEASPPTSACDMVAVCLKDHGIDLTYEAVSKIYTRMKPWLYTKRYLSMHPAL